MDAIQRTKAKSSRRHLTLGHHFIVSPSIAGNPSNDCWNDVDDVRFPLLAAVSLQAGGNAMTVEMARCEAATQLVRVKEQSRHVHR